MSSSATCPKCGAEVKVSDDHSPSDLMECPACKAEFSVSEAVGADPDFGLFSEPSEEADVIPLSAANRSAADDEIDIEALDEIPFDPDLAEEKDDFEIEPISKTTNAHTVADDPLDAILEEALFEDEKKTGQPNIGEQFVETASHSHDEDGDDADGEEVQLDEDELTEVSGDPMEAAFEPVAPEDSGVMPAKAGADEPWNLEPEPTNPKHVAPPPPVETAAKERAQEPRNTVVELVKIIGGGLLGLILAYFVLLWGFKKDLLGLAPLMPEAIVPAELKPVAVAPRMPTPPPDDQQTPPDETTSDSTDNANATNPTPDSGFAAPPGLTATLPGDGTPAATEPPTPAANIPPLDAGTSTPNATPAPNSTVASKIPSLPDHGDPLNATIPLPNMPANSTTANSTLPLPTSPAGNPAPPAGNLPSSDPFGVATTPSAFPPLPQPTVTPPKEPQGLKTEKHTSLAEAQQSMAATDIPTEALYNAPGGAADPNITRLRGNFYVALAKMAEALALIGPQDDDKDNALRSAAIESLGAKLADPSRFYELSRLAGFWLKAQNRASSGIVLAGTVQDVQPQGKLFKTMVQLAGDGETVPFKGGMLVPVMTVDNPRFNAGDSVVVLGAIVKDPMANLHQYEGSDPTVVWGAAVRREQ